MHDKQHRLSSYQREGRISEHVVYDMCAVTPLRAADIARGVPNEVVYLYEALDDATRIGDASDLIHGQVPVYAPLASVLNWRELGSLLVGHTACRERQNSDEQRALQQMTLPNLVLHVMRESPVQPLHGLNAHTVSFQPYTCGGLHLRLAIAAQDIEQQHSRYGELLPLVLSQKRAEYMSSQKMHDLKDIGLWNPGMRVREHDLTTRQYAEAIAQMLEPYRAAFDPQEMQRVLLECVQTQHNVALGTCVQGYCSDMTEQDVCHRSTDMRNIF